MALNDRGRCPKKSTKSGQNIDSKPYSTVGARFGGYSDKHQLSTRWRRIRDVDNVLRVQGRCVAFGVSSSIRSIDHISLIACSSFRVDRSLSFLSQYFCCRTSALCKERSRVDCICSDSNYNRVVWRASVPDVPRKLLVVCQVQF